MRNILLVLVTLVSLTVLSSCTEPPARRSSQNNVISPEGDSTQSRTNVGPTHKRDRPSLEQQRQRNQEFRDKGGNPGRNQPQNRNTYEAANRLPPNGYQYKCPGWAQGFMAQMKKTYLENNQIAEFTLGQVFHDMFDPKRTPISVAEKIDRYCSAYYTSLTTERIILNFDAIQQLMDKDTTSLPVFLTVEKTES